jgi:hypothetical protein
MDPSNVTKQCLIECEICSEESAFVVKQLLGRMGLRIGE